MPTAGRNEASWGAQVDCHKDRTKAGWDRLRSFVPMEELEGYFLSGWVAVNAGTLLPSPSVAWPPA